MDKQPVLVDNWRDAGKWWSVRIAAALAAVGPAWLALPQELKDQVPVAWTPYILPLVAVSIILARVINQQPAE